MPTERESIRKFLRDNPELHRTLRKAVEEGKLKSADEIPEDGDEYIFVCGPDHGGVEGSKQTRCACGALVWMSPSTQELMKARRDSPTRVVCMSCLMREGVKT